VGWRRTPREPPNFTSACDGGNARGCSSLGALYENGGGVNKDERQAAKLYQQACEGGNGRGCAYLGDLYMQGTGVAKDQGRAEQLYQRACEQGYAEGCTDLEKLKGKH